MGLADLGLWAAEDKRIRACLIAALEELIAMAVVKLDDKEKTVSGKLRPLLLKHRKEQKLGWTLHSEVSVFAEETDADPSGHPDFQLSFIDTDGNQWNYDIECKLVRVKRPNKRWDYCEQYVTHGVERFASGKYGLNPPFGTMIGYVQEGEPPQLLSAINRNAKKANVPHLRVVHDWQAQGITRLIHFLSRRVEKDFRLTHLWADLR
jgi:hypothetical protein